MLSKLQIFIKKPSYASVLLYYPFNHDTKTVLTFRKVRKHFKVGSLNSRETTHGGDFTGIDVIFNSLVPMTLPNLFKDLIHFLYDEIYLNVSNNLFDVKTYNWNPISTVGDNLQ